MQKVISNLHIRSQNSIAVQQLTESDANLLPAEVTAATLGGPGQVPRIASMHPGAVASPGMYATRPVVYLQASAVPTVEEIVRDAAAAAARPMSLPALFMELHRRGAAGAGAPVFGAVVPWGMFDTQTLICVRYAHDYVLLQSSVLKRLEAAPTRTLASDTMTKMMQVLPLARAQL